MSVAAMNLRIQGHFLAIDPRRMKHASNKNKALRSCGTGCPRHSVDDFGRLSLPAQSVSSRFFILVMSLLGSDVFALGLGGITVRSALGQPLLGEIAVTFDTAESLTASTCFKLVQPPAPFLATDVPSLRLTEDLHPYDRALISEKQRTILRMEYQLLAKLQEQGQRQLALAERIRALESAVLDQEGSVLSIVMQSRDRMTFSANEPAHSATSSVAAQTLPTGTEWSFLSLLFFFAAFPPIAWLILRRWRLGKTTWAALSNYGVPVKIGGDARMRSAMARVTKPDFLPDEHKLATSTKAMPDVGGATTKEWQNLFDSDRHLESQIELVENHEFENAIELADVMIAFGQAKGAIQALEDFIATDPKTALPPWLKLLEIFRRQDMRAEFDALREKLKLHFNLVPPNWDEIGENTIARLLNVDPQTASFDTLLQQLHATPALTHIVETLRRDWDAPAGLDYINNLLRDNRDGKRNGFSMVVINELVFLCGVLESRLRKTV